MTSNSFPHLWFIPPHLKQRATQLHYLLWTRQLTLFVASNHFSCKVYRFDFVTTKLQLASVLAQSGQEITTLTSLVLLFQPSHLLKGAEKIVQLKQLCEPASLTCRWWNKIGITKTTYGFCILSSCLQKRNDGRIFVRIYYRSCSDPHFQVLKFHKARIRSLSGNFLKLACSKVFRN